MRQQFITAEKRRNLVVAAWGFLKSSLLRSIVICPRGFPVEATSMMHYARLRDVNMAATNASRRAAASATPPALSHLIDQRPPLQLGLREAQRQPAPQTHPNTQPQPCRAPRQTVPASARDMALSLDLA